MFLFQEASAKLIEDWKAIAKFQSIVATQNGELVCGEDKVINPEDNRELDRSLLAYHHGYAVMRGTLCDWTLICLVSASLNDSDAQTICSSRPDKATHSNINNGMLKADCLPFLAASPERSCVLDAFLCSCRQARL